MSSQFTGRRIWTAGEATVAFCLAVLLLLRAEGFDLLINVFADERHDPVCGRADPAARYFGGEGPACRVGDFCNREAKLSGGLASSGYVGALECTGSRLTDGAKAKNDDCGLWRRLY
jgi:hypothetical protein